MRSRCFSSSSSSFLNLVAEPLGPHVVVARARGLLPQAGQGFAERLLELPDARALPLVLRRLLEDVPRLGELGLEDLDAHPGFGQRDAHLVCGLALGVDVPERRRLRELHDGVGLETHVALARQREERLRRRSLSRELGLHADREVFFGLAELDDRHAGEGELADHAHALELQRDEIEELVVPECASRRHAPSFGVQRAGEERALPAEDASQAKEERRRIGDGAEVRHQGEIEGAVAYVEVPGGELADRDASRGARRAPPRAGGVRVVDVDDPRAERREPLAQALRSVADHHDSAARGERLGVKAEGVRGRGGEREGHGRIEVLPALFDDGERRWRGGQGPAASWSKIVEKATMCRPRPS